MNRGTGRRGGGVRARPVDRNLDGRGTGTPVSRRSPPVPWSGDLGSVTQAASVNGQGVPVGTQVPQVEQVSLGPLSVSRSSSPVYPSCTVGGPFLPSCLGREPLRSLRIFWESHRRRREPGQVTDGRHRSPRPSSLPRRSPFGRCLRGRHQSGAPGWVVLTCRVKSPGRRRLVLRHRDPGPDLGFY